MRLPKAWPVPKGITVSQHAGEQYLNRIVDLPYEDETLVRAARHVLVLNLEGRAWPAHSYFGFPGPFRAKLIGPGIKFVYQPEDHRVITVIPGKGENFGLTVPVPADFSVPEWVLGLLRVSWERLTSKRWPVTGGGRDWLGIRVDKRNATLNLRDRTVSCPKSGQGRPPLTAVTSRRRAVAGQ